ncbi:S-layer homology domain-containing protein [Cohnella nanjingensis]|uniref:S-layer homology domain-containing protein n=1 Tax=Cohnella nanjingensis TaxID=1387779 RepID=A0A7X0RNF0_9BACL|nr:S-layer homology domain-containing protein [Cohnella nanjingensis]MBB6670670.1 S-layer homology domain-containing protein [Cohnella nanjingensis]
MASTAEVVKYTMENGDFATDLSGSWDHNGTVERQDYLSMAPGGVVWQSIPVTNSDQGPSVGDTVYASVQVTIDSDVTVQSNVLVRINDGAAALAEINDLTGLGRGQMLELTTQTRDLSGTIGAGKASITVELHNDTPGTIEIHQVKVWGIRADGTTIDYPLANAGFSAPLDGATNWSHGNVERQSALLMQPGSAAWRSLPVSAGEDAPHAGDKLKVQAKVFLDPGVSADASVVVRVNDGANPLVEIKELAGRMKGVWTDAVGIPTGEGAVPEGTDRLWLELHNDTQAPIRITRIQIAGERKDNSFDLNGDGEIDMRDLEYLREQVRSGVYSASLDFDHDGELTDKDVSYFKKFALRDPNEIYANLSHLNFLNEDVTLDGKEMMITHLYAEPVDRDDPSRGYAWVGDPQEGISALDDVARAVIVYVEHYNTYHDAYSLERIKRGLEFAMWMQSPEGDFDNFVAEDEHGRLYKKHSQSSYTDFSYWAVRAYEAMAASLPILKLKDEELAARVSARLDLCLRRLGEKIDPKYGQYVEQGGKKLPGWLLGGDRWLTSGAISALAKHAEVLQDGPQRNAAIGLLAKLGEALAAAQTGDFKEFPYSAFLHSGTTWYEWGSVQVKAMALAGKRTGRNDWVQAAEQAADSFLSHMLISGRAFQLSPNKQEYPQINYGTASYVDNLLALYQVTGKEKYAVLAGAAATWWTGNNKQGIEMFNQRYGYAYDGIMENGVNTNSGAESVDEALRAILRLKRIPASAEMMVGKQVENRGQAIVEAEALYRQNAPEDQQMNLPNGGLKDPVFAIRKQSGSGATNEAAIYEDSLQVGEEQAIYADWQGKNALFVEAPGYNNVRIFDGGYLYQDVPVGGLGQFQAGDSVKLDFAARLEFLTHFDAKVLAIDAQGRETLVADDSTMNYLNRFWYSGQTSVKTTPVAAIPEGTVSLRIRFSNSSDNPNPHEGYVSITQVKLFKMGVPEIRYGNSGLSGSSYVEMPAGSSRAFSASVDRSGEYDVYLSAVTRSADRAATLAVGLNRTSVYRQSLAGEEGAIRIFYLGTAHLEGGSFQIDLTNESAKFPADVDALLFNPVQAYSVYRKADGSEWRITRDSWSGSLDVARIGEEASRQRVRINQAAVKGSSPRTVEVNGIVIPGQEGGSVSGTAVTVSIGNLAAEVRTAADGTFAASLVLPRQWPAGRYRVEASTAAGSGTSLVEIGKESDPPDPVPYPPSSGGQPVEDPTKGSRAIVQAADLNADASGNAKIELADGQDTLVLQGDLSALGFQTLTIVKGNLTLRLPAGLLKEELTKLPAASIRDAAVTVQMIEANEEEAAAFIQPYLRKAGAGYSFAGVLYRLELSVTSGNATGDSRAVHSFRIPIRAEFGMGPEADFELAGVYGLNENSTLEYAGGTVSGNKLIADLKHFGSYGILFYKKSYADLPTEHPAYRAVTVLSARHVLTGTGGDRFKPDRALTRAEYASMMARAYGLSPGPNGSATVFRDISPQAWYAPAIAALTEAGIFRGKSAGRFDPDGVLTMKELRILSERLAARAGAAAPTVPDNGNGRFVTRGEAAQALYEFWRNQK